MDLAQAFVDFTQLGANWVLWLLITLSVISVGVMIDRYLWFRDRDTDTEKFTRELRGAFECDEVERIEAKYKNDLAIPVQVALRGLAERGRGPEAVAEAMHSERAKWRHPDHLPVGWTVDLDRNFSRRGFQELHGAMAGLEAGSLPAQGPCSGQ